MILEKLQPKRAKRPMKGDPANIDAYHLLAGIPLKERYVQSTVATMEKAVAMAPEEFNPRMFLAHLYDTTGKKDKAEQALRPFPWIRPNASLIMNCPDFTPGTANGDAPRLIL